MDTTPAVPRPDRPRRLAIWELCALIAGVGIGVWLNGITPGGDADSVGVIVGTLGGAPLIGPPVLLWDRRRGTRRHRWGPGETLWFATGAAAWLLWPAAAYLRVSDPAQAGVNASQAAMFFAVVAPLMAICVGAALLFGGRVRRRDRRRRASWYERFGLILGILWAATGLWFLCLIYLFSLS